MKNNVFIILLFFFIAACTTEQSINLGNSTLTPTENLTSAPTTTPSSDCEISIETASKQNLINGKLFLSGILHKPNSLLISPSYIFDWESGEYIPVLQDENRQILDWTFTVSPNGRYVAYIDNLSENPDASTILHVVNSEGIEENKVLLGFRPGNIKWANNNELYVEIIHENSDSSNDKPDASLSLINKNNGDFLEVNNQYPGQWNGGNLFWDFTLSRVVFNSSFTRVIYPAYEDPNRIIRLVDTENNETIVDIPTTDYGKLPIWSPDEKNLAFVTQTNPQASENNYHDEIFIVNDSGNVYQLTDISSNTNYSYITGISWSPDSRYIAFWVNDSSWEEGYRGVHLSIIDTKNKDISQYCSFKDLNGTNYMPLSNSPIWSLDGKYLALNLVDKDKEERNIVVILDLIAAKAYHVGDEFLALGWME